MNIKVTENEKECILAIEGRVDTMTAPQLEEAVADHADSCDKMIPDLSDTEYISSAGLRTILLANETIGDDGVITVKGANPMIMDIFDTTGFSAMLNLI